ncbi:copper chaperone PCu(A)C [Novispirillum sp. DQ9]|uniref:copper chaperone PCu(A)C n=1 Tax=Novispirillum sp. DQ9 TaxID=3398612 RepID=UPI003C7C11AC
MQRLISTAAGLAVALTLSLPALAGDITVSDAWSRASAGPARAGAGFMTITNAGAEADRLVAAAAPVSATAELHTHVQDGDVMRMREVAAIDVPAGQTVTLQPGGLHVMLMSLHAPLKEGQSFDLTLTFEKAGTVVVPVTVRAAGAMGAGMGHDTGAGMKHGH